MRIVSKVIEALGAAFSSPAAQPAPPKTLLPPEDVMQAARDGNVAVVMHHFGENFTGHRGCIRSNGDMLLAAAEAKQYETVEAILSAHAHESVGVPGPSDIDLGNMQAVETLAQNDPALHELLIKYDEIANANFERFMAELEAYDPRKYDRLSAHM
jgi:hypothetical protein